MNQQIKQIAERLKGLRDALNIDVAEFARIAGVTPDKYHDIESGEIDIPISILHQISQHYQIDLATIMFGNEAHMASYFLTRAGKGPIVERMKAYQYQALAAGFTHRKVTPFVVTIEPTTPETPIQLNAHSGQEFNLVTKGEILIHINGKELILNEGDSIYFDSALPHGMKALNNHQAQFLAIII